MLKRLLMAIVVLLLSVGLAAAFPIKGDGPPNGAAGDDTPLNGFTMGDRILPPANGGEFIVDGPKIDRPTQGDDIKLPQRPDIGDIAMLPNGDGMDGAPGFDHRPVPGPGNGPAPVPEPGTIVLLGAGLAGLAWYRRKK
jgi:hypothetical protein